MSDPTKFDEQACIICGTQFDVEYYHDVGCPNCGQRYLAQDEHRSHN